MSEQLGEPFDFWHLPAKIERNNFKFKSLSCWSLNISVGCSHACRFCYVPSVATNKQGPTLARYGVDDPDAQWGEYSLLRPWDENVFRASLRKAENTDPDDLNPDGNRAVILCSTTDPYQVFRATSFEKRQALNEKSLYLVQSALELILNESSLNVRILTRSPLARKHFDLFRRFGDRLLFGMSLPTLDDQLARIYEPGAPSPSQRLKTLRLAKQAQLNIYVAVAPTYPECDEADLRRTLLAVRDLDPVTIFHEPINMRAENVSRIEEHAKSLGKTLRTEVFQTPGHWAHYALRSLHTVERLAGELDLLDRLHLWPDQNLANEKAFFAALRTALPSQHQPRTHYEETRWQEAQRPALESCKTWIEGWHSRISEWPGIRGGKARWQATQAA